MGVGIRARLEVQVRFPGRPGRAEATEAVHFEANRPLEDQLKGLCLLRDIPYNQDENYQVLVGTGGSSGSTAGVVLGSVRALGDLPPRSTCELRPAVEVANAQLSRIDGASRALGDPARRRSLQVALGVLLRSTRDSTWFAEEIVAQEGLQVLLDSLVLAAPQGGEDQQAAASRLAMAELAAACLGELLQYENGLAWCEQSSESLPLKEVFGALLSAVLAASNSAGVAKPKASLGLALFLLAALPGLATGALHMAGTADADSLYRRAVKAGLCEEPSWRGSAAAALLAALLEAAHASHYSVAAVESALRRAGEREDAGDAVAELLSREPMDLQGRWIQQLLADSLTGSSELACRSLDVEAAIAYSERMEKRAERGAQHEARCKRLETRLQRVEEEMRRAHLAMRAMVRLVDVGDHPFLRENLEVIVRSGYDGVRWEKGYTALHYAAEAVSDKNVIEMLCHLASNVDTPDDEGLRPADYARRAGKVEAVSLIEDCKRQREEPVPAQPAAPPLPPTHSVARGAGPMRALSPAPVAQDGGSMRKKLSVAFKDGPRTNSEIVQAAIHSQGETNLRWASVSDDSGLEAQQPVRVLARQLRGYLFKNATSGTFWSKQNKRYFAMTAVHPPPPGAPSPHFEFGYWESEEAFRNGATAKGAINATQIFEITHGVKGSAEASIKYREGANVKELVVIAKDSAGMPCAQDAQEWAGRLQEFCKLLKEAQEQEERICASQPSLPPTTTTRLDPNGAINNARSVDSAISLESAPGSGAAAPRPARGQLLAAATARTREAESSGGGGGQRPPMQSMGMPAQPWVALESQGAEAADMALPLDTVARQRRKSSGQRAPRGQQVKIRPGIHESSSREGSSSFLTMDSEDGYTSDPGAPGQPAYFRMNSLSSVATERAEKEPDVFNIASVNSLPGVSSIASSTRGLAVFNISSIREQGPAVFNMGSVNSLAEEPRRSSGPPTYSMERLYQDSSWVFEDGEDPEQPSLSWATSAEKLYEDTSWLDVLCSRRSAGQQREGAGDSPAAAPGGGGLEVERGISLSGIEHPVFTLAHPLSRAGSKEPPRGSTGGASQIGDQAPGSRFFRVAADVAARGLPGQSPMEGQQSPLQDGPVELSSLSAAPSKPAAERSSERGGSGDAASGSAAGGTAGGASGSRASAGPSGKAAGGAAGEAEATGGAAQAAAGADTAGAGQSAPVPLASPTGGKGAKGKGGPPPPPKAPPPGAKGEGKGAKGKDAALQDKNLQQPFVQPKKAMKALWWTRLEYGRQLKEGTSVWDCMKDYNLNVPLDAFEDRFCKQVPKKTELAQVQERRKNVEKGLTELRICKDPNKIVGKEGALRNFPTPEAVAQALIDLDHTVLSPYDLGKVKDFFCPLPQEVSLLEEIRRENPNVPFAPPERYMWYVSRVPAFRARVECWDFINNYKERAAQLAAALAEFQCLEDSLLQSQALPQLLALILWVGNYLNGGTKRGRADGFDLEDLNKLDSVKDNKSDNKCSRDVRHFIHELFFIGMLKDAEEDVSELQVEVAYQTGMRLLEDFAALFRNVNRTLTARGSLKKVVKNVKVVLEDVEKDVAELLQLFATRQESLTECLKYSEDPVDAMKLTMAEKFAEARPLLLRLETQAKRCREGYTRLLAHFNHPGMKTQDFVLLWDDFFIPGDLIMNKPDIFQKSEILPHFCKPLVVPSVDNLMVLWEIRTPQEVCEAAALRRQRLPLKRRVRPQQRTATVMAPSVARCAKHWRKRASMSKE